MSEWVPDRKVPPVAARAEAVRPGAEPGAEAPPAAGRPAAAPQGAAPQAAAPPADLRTHHLLKHYLSTTQRDGALQHFTTNEVKEAAKDISRMGQRELQAKFRLVYGTNTHSNNNDWLRRKLYEAIGASPVKAASKGKLRKPAAKARKSASSLDGEAGAGGAETRKRLHRAADAERKRLHVSLPATPLARHASRRGGAGAGSAAAAALAGLDLSAPFAFARDGSAGFGDEDAVYASTDADTPRSEGLSVASFHSTPTAAGVGPRHFGAPPPPGASPAYASATAPYGSGAAAQLQSCAPYGSGAAAQLQSCAPYGSGAAAQLQSCPPYGSGAAAQLQSCPPYGSGAAAQLQSCPPYGSGAPSQLQSCPPYGSGAAAPCGSCAAGSPQLPCPAGPYAGPGGYPLGPAPPGAGDRQGACYGAQPHLGYGSVPGSPAYGAAALPPGLPAGSRNGSFSNGSPGADSSQQQQQMGGYASGPPLSGTVMPPPGPPGTHYCPYPGPGYAPYGPASQAQAQAYPPAPASQAAAAAAAAVAAAAAKPLSPPHALGAINTHVPAAPWAAQGAYGAGAGQQPPGALPPAAAHASGPASASASGPAPAPSPSPSASGARSSSTRAAGAPQASLLGQQRSPSSVALGLPSRSLSGYGWPARGPEGCGVPPIRRTFSLEGLGDAFASSLDGFGDSPDASISLQSNASLRLEQMDAGLDRADVWADMASDVAALELGTPLDDLPVGADAAGRDPGAQDAVSGAALARAVAAGPAGGDDDVELLQLSGLPGLEGVGVLGAVEEL